MKKTTNRRKLGRQPGRDQVLLLLEQGRAEGQKEAADQAEQRRDLKPEAAAKGHGGDGAERQQNHAEPYVHAFVSAPPRLEPEQDHPVRNAQVQMRDREAVPGLFGHERNQEECRDADAGQRRGAQRPPFTVRPLCLCDPEHREEQECVDGIHEVGEEQQADPETEQEGLAGFLIRARVFLSQDALDGEKGERQQKIYERLRIVGDAGQVQGTPRHKQVHDSTKRRAESRSFRLRFCAYFSPCQVPVHSQGAGQVQQDQQDAQRQHQIPVREQGQRAAQEVEQWRIEPEYRESAVEHEGVERRKSIFDGVIDHVVAGQIGPGVDRGGMPRRDEWIAAEDRRQHQEPDCQPG